MKCKEKYRLTLELTPPVKARLDRLRDGLEGGTYNEAVRRALRLMEFLTDAAGDGVEIIIRDGDRERILVLP